MHPNASAWWTNEFKLFFNPETGIDIDGLWIDMNEPTNVSQQSPPTPGQNTSSKACISTIKNKNKELTLTNSQSSSATIHVLVLSRRQLTEECPR